MRPLILEFAEEPDAVNLDYSIIEYSPKDNLSVTKGTNVPAISFANLETETFAKTISEPSDLDDDIRIRLNKLIDTSTQTLVVNEPSDSDHNYTSLGLLMDTQTITESIEPTDSDK